MTDTAKSAETSVKPSLGDLVRAVEMDATYEDSSAALSIISAKAWLDSRAPPSLTKKRTDSTDEKPEAFKICTEPDCDRIAAPKGLCAKHLKDKNICAVENCLKVADQNKVCVEHKDVSVTCSREGCTRLATKDGVCSKHGANKARCLVAGCDNYAIRNKICIKHGAYDKRCGIKGCRRVARNKGMCLLHNPINLGNDWEHEGVLLARSGLVESGVRGFGGQYGYGSSGSAPFSQLTYASLVAQLQNAQSLLEKQNLIIKQQQEMLSKHQLQQNLQLGQQLSGVTEQSSALAQQIQAEIAQQIAQQLEIQQPAVQLVQQPTSQLTGLPMNPTALQTPIQQPIQPQKRQKTDDKIMKDEPPASLPTKVTPNQVAPAKANGTSNGHQDSDGDSSDEGE